MELTNLSKPEDQTVTFVELFFDLVFVFSITQVVELLHHDFTWLAVGQMVLVFWLIWWAWTQFAWTLNSADTEKSFIQLGVLLATGVAFFMAVGVPQAFENGTLWFAVPYIIVRIIGNFISFIVSRENTNFRDGLITWFILSAVGVTAVLIGALLGGVGQYWIWGLAILLDVYAANVSGRREDFDYNMHPAHFSERHGLFVIIALGETLILAASGASKTLWTNELLITAILAVAVTGGLWWSYFHSASPALEHVLASSPKSKQARIAVDSYSFTHFLMLSGIIAYAAAIEQAISHPTQALPLPETIALAIGMILFVSGMAVAQWTSARVLPKLKIFLNVVTGIVIVSTFGVDVIVTLGIALVGVVAIGIYEK